MSTLPRNVASIYNPDLLTKAQLIDSFVIRVKKFEKLFADIKTATMEKPEQHLMVVGLRGMGKTTLLRRLAYEVENDSALNIWLMPVIFNEEEYGITQLFKLWETIAEYIEKHDPVFTGLYDRMDAEYRLLKNDQHRYEQIAFELLVNALHEHHKKLLLFIDNFGDMFKRFKKPEKQRLREILMTCPDLRIIAASSVVIEAFFKYDDPLFEFFKTERLDALDSEETKTLLLKLGENLPDNRVQTIIEQQPERVEALRRLTGGIPRSIVLFFEIFVTDKDGTAFTDLESILDRVTPLYKHRMDDLPTQQQEIMSVLALNYDGMSSREIADRTRLESKLVSAQLKQLQKDNLISIANPGSKNQIYHVYDRFFNIWFLMRMARKGDKNRVLWLVRFLECWCTPEQLSKRSDTHRKALMQQEYDPKAALSFTNALYYAAQEDIDTRYRLAKQTQDYLKDRAPDLYEQTETADIAFFGRGIAEMRRRDWEASYRELSAIKDKNAQDYLLLYVLEERKGASGRAAQYLQQARLADKNLCIDRLIGEIYWKYFKDDLAAERYYLAAIKQGDAKACRGLGNIFRDKRKNYAEAEKYYKIAIERGETYSWINLGDLYGDTLKNYPQAEICYQKGVEEGHAIGWRYLGILYADDLKEYEKAKEYYQKAIDAEETYGWINLGQLYRNNLKDYSQAETCYQKGVEEGQSDGWRYLGILYADNLKEYEKAKEYYQKAINAGETFAWITLGDLYGDTLKNYPQAEICYQKGVEEGHAIGWRFLGILYADDLKEYEKAKEYYQKAIDAGETFAWINQGNLYRNNLKDYPQAETCYQKSAEEGHGDGWRYLGILYADNLKEYEKAKEYYQKAIDAGETYAWFNLGILYQNNLKDYLQAATCYQKCAEQGHAIGSRYLGILYADTLKDYEAAKEYYQKAIDAGETFAWINLGNLYRNNLKDYPQAATCYHKGGEEGHAIGWHYLGILYAGNLKEYEKAKEYYQKAIAAGETFAWINLGNLYRDDLKDYPQTEACYQKSVEAGQSDGWRYLGALYADNLKEYEKAKEFYQKAIDAGETFAWINLGDLYGDTLKDYPQAEICYRKGVEDGHAIGWCYLGILYADNLKDYETAKEYFQKAIDAGEPSAWANLGVLYQNNLKDYLQAAKCYQKCVEEGDAIGWRYLGILYTNNLKDYEKAKEYYQKAVDKDETYAWINLGDLYGDTLKDYPQAVTCYQKGIQEGHAIGWHYMGYLYSGELKNIDKAEDCFQRAIHDGIPEAYNSLAWSYFTHKIKAPEALEVAIKAYHEIPENYVAHTLSCVYLWNDRFEEAHETAGYFLFNRDYLDKSKDDKEFLDYFLLLLAKSQYTFLYDYFTGEPGEVLHSKDRFLPLWYALMHYMKTDHPMEYLRTPPELKETVQEIIDKVEEYQVAYRIS